MIDLKDYTGDRIPARIADEGMRRGFITNWEHMAANYGRGVDAQLLEGQILLCEQTAEELYRAPQPTRYVKGTRPVLDRVAEEIFSGAKNETECAIRAMRYTRDLHKKHKGWHPFFGGTEEVLIEKGEELCECVARLAVALLEIRGIPARIITHTIGGHVTAEAYADGKWGYIDPRCGMYFLLEDGRLASLIELLRDPAITERQSDAVKADVSHRWTHAERVRALLEKYLSEKEVNTFKYYSLADEDKYDYSWQTDEMCIELDMNRICRAYGEVRREVMFPSQPKPEGRMFPVRFTLPDGVVLSEDVLLGVRVGGVMCHPKRARFILDGEEIYSTDGWIPTSEISSFQHGVLFLGGANGSLPVSRLSEGEHLLVAELEVNRGETARGELRFTVKRP